MNRVSEWNWVPRSYHNFPAWVTWFWDNGLGGLWWIWTTADCSPHSVGPSSYLSYWKASLGILLWVMGEKEAVAGTLSAPRILHSCLLSRSLDRAFTWPSEKQTLALSVTSCVTLGKRVTPLTLSFFTCKRGIILIVVNHNKTSMRWLLPCSSTAGDSCPHQKLTVSMS